MNTNVYGDFQICISVPLKLAIKILGEGTTFGQSYK